MCIIPGIWFLQVDLYQTRRDYRDENELEECGIEIVMNATGLRNINGVSIPISLGADSWVLVLEQIMFFLLILGRWLLPKGQLSRDQLSQLLLVYVGIAADSLEFSLETLKVQRVLCDFLLISLILGVWSWSLLQFTLVLTSVSAPRPRMAATKRSRSFCGGCCENEIWALIITMCLQDAPYLAMRLYLIVDLRVINQMMIFFTVKNSILVILQLYRMGVLCCMPKEQVEPMDMVDSQVTELQHTPTPERSGKFNAVAMETVLAEEFETIDYDGSQDGVPHTDHD
ncbi:transmembrane protein 26-like [Amphiura filiformis]|uniref:transmembrane protein 26-like n=1 Tax=Amphiura filiformis TaxID=82378 RepID=UPI003B21EEBC